MSLLDQKTDGRYVWLDYVRFFAIFLVVFGHTELLDQGKTMIYAFHMPLFFVISGFLFPAERRVSFGEFVAKRARELLLPYLVFSVVAILFWRLLVVPYGSGPQMSFSWSDIGASLFLGQHIVYGLHLWFLPTLFVTEILLFLFLFVFRFKPYWIFLASVVLGFGYAYFVGFELIWGVDIALIALGFMAVGKMLRGLMIHREDDANRVKAPVRITDKGRLLLVAGLLFLIFGVCTVLLSIEQGPVNMMARQYGNFLLYMVVALCGTGAVFALGVCCFIVLNKLRWVSYIATYTVVIYLLHMEVMAVASGLIKRLVGLPEQTLHSAAYNMGLTILVLLILTPIIGLIVRFAPWVIGRKANRV